MKKNYNKKKLYLFIIIIYHLLLIYSTFKKSKYLQEKLFTEYKNIIFFYF